MIVQFDPAKSERNAAERGLPFTMAAEVDWSSAVSVQDTRFAYPEPRFVAMGYIGERLFVICYTPIIGGIRVISFRKANKREVRRHER